MTAFDPLTAATGRARGVMLGVALGAALLTSCTSTTTPIADGPRDSAAPTTAGTSVVATAAALDGSNTGWRHTGVQLRNLRCDARGEVVITVPGTVIDGMSIPCSVKIAANDVTISRSFVRATGVWGIAKDDKFSRLTVTDTEIAGTPACSIGIGFSGVMMRGLDVHGCSDGVRIETGSVLENSWVHDLATGPGPDGGVPHNDGVQTTGGSDITIRNNKIENPRHQTSAILIGGNFGDPSDILIEDNYLNGGNYTIYLDPKGQNRVVRNNTFTRNFVFGPASVRGSITWTGNVYPDGAPVPR